MVIEHIRGLPHGRANLKQLLRELARQGIGRKDLEAELKRLIERGELVETRAGHYVAVGSSREFATGRLSVHRDGYGFVIPDRPVSGLKGDVYVPKEGALKAMHGDRVVVRVGRIGGDGRAEGEIIRVLRRAHPSVVGEFRVRRSGNVVVPHDDRIKQWIEIPDEFAMPPAAAAAAHRVGAREIKIESIEDLEGLIVTAEILDFGEEGERPLGRITEVLGIPTISASTSKF